jgi:hypothetical protein
LRGDPANPDFITVALQISNTGTMAVPMADLTVRYWYTYDTTPIVTQTAACNYAHTPPTACSNITYTSWTQLPTPRMNADWYYQIGFTPAAGNLNPGAMAEFQTQFHKNDWQNFTQTNDYSFNNATSFMTTTKVTVYRAGFLIYGTEPM